MAKNKILPWAQTGTANVLSDTDYASGVATGGLYGNGVKTGQASSQQANKTWRQATAPGSGLGQFLVDNLGVDVTDADIPSTFSTRIANAVLKLAQISPFNQSWATATGGYRKYAIVSDSSGNFWVSTTDANTTMPGAAGAKWKSLFDGYATQAWADNRYMPLGGNVITTGNYTTTQWMATSITTQTVSGVINHWGGYLISKLEGRDVTTSIFSWEKEGQDQGATIEISGYDLDVRYTFPKNGRIISPAGNMAVLSDLAPYALTSALSEETSRAEAAEALKANLAGGNSFTEQQTVNGNVWLVGTNPATSSGVLNVSPYFTTGMTGRGTVSLWNREVVNSSNQAAITVAYNGTEQTRFYVNNDGSLSTTQKGSVAFTSQLPTAGTITNGTYTKVPLNDGSGKSVLTQNFNATVSNHGVIAFPISFSGSVDNIGITMTVAGNYDADHYTNNVTLSQFTVGIFGDATNVPFDITATGIV